MMRMLRLLTIATALMAAGCSRDPGRSTQQHIDAGDHYAQAGQYKEASIEYRNAIKTTPTSVEAHARLADTAARANDLSNAVGEMLRVAELNPDDVAAQVRAASIYLLAGRFEDARDRAEAALHHDSRDVGAHIVLGQALAGLHDAARSEERLTEAVRIAPQSVEAHVALGSHY